MKMGPSPRCEVGATGFAKHNGIYGLGEWREVLDSKQQAVLISSPSWAGAYPWIDKTHHVYGIFLAHVDVAAAAVAKDHFNAFYASPVIPIVIGKVIDETDQWRMK